MSDDLSVEIITFDQIKMAAVLIYEQIVTAKMQYASELSKCMNGCVDSRCAVDLFRCILPGFVNVPTVDT